MFCKRRTELNVGDLVRLREDGRIYRVRIIFYDGDIGLKGVNGLSESRIGYVTGCELTKVDYQDAFFEVLGLLNRAKKEESPTVTLAQMQSYFDKRLNESLPKKCQSYVDSAVSRLEQKITIKKSKKR